MLWRPDYMPNYGIGMPQMDLDAPRLLAHTHLFEIDALFSGDSSLDFARYMDDMDFGVDSIAKAKTVLRDLDLALQTRNLRLNSGKTKILTASEARRHFRVEDNERYVEIEKRLSSAAVGSVRQKYWIKALARIIEVGVRRAYFDSGNGDKVLKRLISLATKWNVSVPVSSFRKILYNKPALRDGVLRNWSSTGDQFTNMGVLSGFLRSGEAIDDVAQILICTHFVNGRNVGLLPAVDLSFLISSFSKESPSGLYCRLWMISRFGTSAELKSEIDSTSMIWSRHRHLSRLVAGFYGLFKLTSHFASFEAFVRKWGGVEAATMLDFHESLSGTAAGYHSVAKFIKAPNTSLPNEITHSKTLMLASMLSNSAIPKIDRAKLLSSASTMMGDIYYRSIFSTIISAAP